MDRRLVLRRLCWKEYRQLMPLIVMLAVIALLLQCLLLLDRVGNRNASLPIYFFFGLPGLFAAGVGALLVGQEKENRTLYWMASLPVHKEDIVRVKFLAGFVGLVAVWIISFLMMLVTGGLSNDYGPISIREIDLPHGILYSMFLLVLGFATAWGFRSSFAGLLVLAGVALAYTFATNFFFNNSDAINSITLIVSIAVALGVGWIHALRTLSPTAPPTFSQPAISGSSYFERSIVDQRAILSPWSSLIWQFAIQNRAMLLGISAMYLIPLLLCYFAIAPNSLIEARGFGDIEANLPIPSIVIAFISISWLGVIVFQGDNLYQRIRFLADRGIAPNSVWMTRQILPFGMLILGVTALVVAAVGNMFLYKTANHVPNIGLLVLCAIGSMWTIYSVTQWISQIVRSPIIAAIIAPVISLFTFALGGIAVDVLETPIWMLALVTFIPMIATFRMTGHWMDARVGQRFWLEHTGWLTLAALITAIPFLVTWATYPSMPASEWTEFRTEAVRHLRSKRNPIEITLLAPNSANAQGTGTELPDSEAVDSELGVIEGGEAASAGMGHVAIGGDEALDRKELPIDATLSEERSLQLAFIERQLSWLDNSTPISSSYFVVKRLMGDAMLTRARMEDDGTSQELLKRYQRNVGIIVRIIRGVRLMQDLKSQQFADHFEAWLVQETQRDGAQGRFGAEIWSAAVSQLSDKTSRRNARYMALSMDFYLVNSTTQRRSATEHSIGGYSIPTSKNGTRLISSRHVATVVWHMKQLLYASDDSSKKQAVETVARDWDTSTLRLGQTATPFSMQSMNVPCSHWHGAWEKQADALE